jgi:hypothetical protein
MSNLSLERLLFDAANPTDGPLIGSYLLGSGGAVISETGTSLDVNLTNASVAVTATDLDIRDLTHVSDSIKIGDGTDFLAVNADGSINVSGTITLDTDADDAPSTLNPVYVGGISADQGSALAAISAAGDRAAFTTDLYRRLFINDAPNVAVASVAVSVGLTAVALPTAALAGRTRILIQNNGDKPLFVGPTGVTTASGLEVPKGGTLALEAGEAIALFGISTAAAQDVRVFELA